MQLKTKKSIFPQLLHWAMSHQKTNNLWIFLFQGIGVSLKSLLKDSDATVRHKATEVLGIIAGIKESSFTFTSLEKKNVHYTYHIWKQKLFVDELF